MPSKKNQDRTEEAGDRQIVSALPALPVARAGNGMFGDMPLTGYPVAAAALRPALWMTVTKQKWSIFWVFVIVAGTITAAVWLLLPPQYTANAEIRVRPIIPRLVYQTDDNGRIPLYESFMNTQAAVVASPTVLQRVLDQPDVQATAWFKGVRKGPMGFVLSDDRPAIERLRELLKVRPRGQTEIIDVWMSADWPQDARTLVNAVLDQYMRYIRESADQTRDVLYRKLLEQYRTLQNDINGREKVLARMKKEYTTNVPAELVDRERLRLDEIASRLEDVQRRLAQSRWQESQWEHLIDQGDRLTRLATTQPESLAANQRRFPTDAEWRQLQIAFKQIEYRLEQTSGQLGDAHPKMIDISRRVELAADMLRTRELQLVQQWRLNPGEITGPGEEAASVDDKLAAAHRRTRMLQFQEKVLQEDLSQLRKGWENTVDTAMSLEQQTQLIQRKREMFQDVRLRKDQREMERNVPGSVEVLTRAFAPSKPSRDYRMLATLAAIMTGLGCGVGLAMVRAGRSQVITEVRELHHSVAAPFLGHLPLLERKHEAAPDRSGLANEGIRMVRTALLAHIEARDGNAVVVTSAGQGEGKSTVAWLLARSFARCSMSVLLIDGDLRGRDVSKRFGMDQGKGFVGALIEDAPDAETILETDLPTLSFLPAGRHSGPVETEIVANGSLPDCLARWREMFDVVVVDSPPLLSVADGRILARHADGTILVVKEDHSHRHAVADALRSLEAASAAPLWGTVFVGELRRLPYDYHHRAPMRK